MVGGKRPFLKRAWSYPTIIAVPGSFNDKRLLQVNWGANETPRRVLLGSELATHLLPSTNSAAPSPDVGRRTPTAAGFGGTAHETTAL